MKFTKIFSISLALMLFCGVISAQTERDRGLQLYKSGNFNAALDAFKKATKADPKDFQSWCYLGLTYLKQGEVKDSIKALNKAAQLGPNEPTVHVGLATPTCCRTSSRQRKRRSKARSNWNPKAPRRIIYWAS